MNCKEKRLILFYYEDVATFVVNALGPAEVEKVVIEEELKKIDVIVPDEQLSLAIGRKDKTFVLLVLLLVGILIF